MFAYQLIFTFSPETLWDGLCVWTASLVCLLLGLCAYVDTDAALSSVNPSTLFPSPPVIWKTHAYTHSLSPGGCFRCSHRRSRSDNRLWQMSRHHLKAVTYSRIETNRRCHCVARSKLVWRQTLLSISCFTITRSVSLVLSLVIRSDLRAVSLPEGHSVRLAASCLLSFYSCWPSSSALLRINLLCLALKLLYNYAAEAKVFKTKKCSQIFNNSVVRNLVSWHTLAQRSIRHKMVPRFTAVVLQNRHPLTDGFSCMIYSSTVSSHSPGKGLTCTGIEVVV